MDATDIKILRHMGVQPFIEWPRDIDHLKPSFFAKKLKLSPETAKQRIRRMEKDGAIRAYEIYPNWSHLGLLRAWQLFHCADYGLKARMVRELTSVDGVCSVENFLGPDVGCEILYRTEPELRRRVQVVSGLLGGAPSVAYVPSLSFPAKEPLSALDWRIIQALRHRANRPLPEVAKELRVSARTVRRRVDQMWESGAIDTVVQIDVGKITNHIFCNFHIRFKSEQDPAAAQRIYKDFDSDWAYCWAPPDRQMANLVAGMLFRSPGDIERAIHRIQAIPGVASAEPFVTTNFVWHEDWLDEAIDAKAREAAAARPLVAASAK